MRVGVLAFPGSNCDHACYHFASEILGCETRLIWHEERSLPVDLVIVPGGFSYGDYLRCGAIARFAPVMDALRDFAAGGKPVIGICNGFQILTEAGLLPGTLLRNRQLHFVCKDVYLKVASRHTPFTQDLALDTVLRVPVAHGEGQYFASSEELTELRQRQQLVLTYCNANGQADAAANPNGSSGDIAGVCNRSGNVLGMMPHPERCGEELLGNRDGIRLFDSLLRRTVLA